MATRQFSDSVANIIISQEASALSKLLQRIVRSNADSIAQSLYSGQDSFWGQLTTFAANKILCQDFTRLLSQLGKLSSVGGLEEKPTNKTIVRYFDVAIARSSNLNPDAFKGEQLLGVIKHLTKHLFRHKGSLNFLKKNLLTQNLLKELERHLTKEFP